MTMDMQIQPVTLEGRHVTLRPMAESDIDALTSIALDPDLWKYTTTIMRTRSDVAEYVGSALEGFRAGTVVPFVTTLNEGKKVVGSTRFANIDTANRRAEIGWTWIGREWQRSPVNTEAKYLMLRHAFETWKCMRVELKTGTLNQRSRNAILRIGAKEEGILRKHMILHDGRIRDTIYFSILDEEWGEVKKRLEEKMEKQGEI